MRVDARKRRRECIYYGCQLSSETQTRRDETVEHSLPTELRSLYRGRAVSARRSADVSMTSGELLTERGVKGVYGRQGGMLRYRSVQ